MDSDQEIVMEDDVELDDQYAKGLIKGVIDRISQSSGSPKAASRRRRRAGRPKGTDIPEFELKDIMGDFEIDDGGNHVILRGPGTTLLDMQNRLVNKRGYLTDKFGNVVDRTGRVVFKVQDLDSEGEIPATYVFEKRKETLMNKTLSESNEQFKVNKFGHGAGAASAQQKDLRDSYENEDDIVERELNEFKRGVKMSASISESRS